MMGSSGRAPQSLFLRQITDARTQWNFKGNVHHTFYIYQKTILPNDNCQHENYLKTEMQFIKSCFIQQGLITPNKNPKTPEVVLQHECGFCGILYGIEVAFIRGCSSGDQNNHQPNSGSAHFGRISHSKKPTF